MSAWSELKKRKRTAIASGIDPVVLLYPDDDNPQYEIYAQKWIGHGPPQHSIIAPQGWIELWPSPALVADDWPEARKLHLELVNRLTYDNSLEGFEIRPSFLKAVDVVLHPKVPCNARIYHQRDGNYQIDFDASFLPRAWIPEGYDVVTIASTLDEANEIAWAFFQGYLDGTSGLYDESWKTIKLFPLGLTPEGHWPVRES